MMRRFDLNKRQPSSEEIVIFAHENHETASTDSILLLYTLSICTVYVVHLGLLLESRLFLMWREWLSFLVVVLFVRIVVEGSVDLELVRLGVSPQHLGFDLLPLGFELGGLSRILLI